MAYLNQVLLISYSVDASEVTQRAIYRIYLDFGPDCCWPFLTAMHGLTLYIDFAIRACGMCNVCCIYALLVPRVLHFSAFHLVRQESLYFFSYLRT